MKLIKDQTIQKDEIFSLDCSNKRRGIKIGYAVIIGALFMLSLGFTVGYAQSEHAVKIAESFKGTEYDDYAEDILVNKPDYVVFTPKKDKCTRGDTYNDHFQVFNKQNGMLFAVWTQATDEGDIDQHIAFSRSTDGGLSWSEPDILAGSKNYTNPQLAARWEIPMVSKSGRIYVLWNQQVATREEQKSGHHHYGRMFGIYSDDNGETWSAPEKVKLKRMDRDPIDLREPAAWLTWQRPLRLGKNGKYLVGVSRHGRAPYDKQTGNVSVTEFLQFDNIDDDPEVKDIELSWFATNKNSLVVEHEKFGSNCEEASIVELPDGRLFALMRTSSGYPYWSQSFDRGKTWSSPKKLKNQDGGTPYLHPRSPCPIYDWKGPEAASGYYFAFVHDTFNFDGENEWQERGPLYLLAGKFNKDAEQPIEFAPKQLFAERETGNSFYTSITVVDDKTVLWFPDKKFYLLGRIIGEEWFDYFDEVD